MRTIWRLILFSSCALGLARAQSTTVSATVVDQSSVTWANGTWALDFVPNPNSGSPPFWNGNPFPSTQWHYSGALDSSGHFSQSVPSNNFITPSGSTYTVTVCPNATAQCSIIIRETFQGTSMDISTTITNNTPAISVKPGPLAIAYNDNQVNVQNSQVGYFYLNVTSGSPRYWNGLAWNPFGGTLTSVGVASFPPLFTTTASGPANAPLFTFSPQLAIGNAVYGTCGGPSNAFPNFCQLTSGMVANAGTLSNDTTGNSATTTQFAAAPTLCSGSLYAKGVGALGNASCASIAFTNIVGNIAVTQMNNGTSADSSHYWRGDGTWATVPTGPTGHDYYFNYTGCTITNGSNLNNCTATITWSSVGLSGATITSTDYLGCTVDTFNSYTASWSLGGTGMSSSNFQYYWTEIMANSGTTATPTISCHLHTAA